MISDDEKAKLRFALANTNMQSIGRAQGLYVTALLTYICLFWALFFVGSSEISIHLGWLDLRLGGIWGITPFVLLILTLAYIGTVTAATPALVQLREAEEAVFGSREHSFFEFDTHKNLLDYLARLQFAPWGVTRKPKDYGGRIPHLILPILFLGSAFTSYRAIHELSKLGQSHRAAVFFGWCCLVSQCIFSLRPMRRFLWRFVGAKRTSDVYN
jgi:hypothetical protein